MLTALSVVAAVVMSVSVGVEPPGVGDLAPAIEVGEVIRADAGGGVVTEPSEGRVLVVEFWATWCGPCLPAMAHLGEVAEALRGEPVDFVTLTPESPEAVRTFLERHELTLPIATDSDEATFGAYGIRVVPTTVIIAADGTIAARTRPTEVTADSIRAILAGKEPGLSERVDVVPNLDWAPETTGEGEVYAQVVIDASEATSSRAKLKPGSGLITADGMPVSSLVTFAWDVPHGRVDWGGHSFGDEKYRVYARAPGGEDDLARAMMGAALKAKFGFDARLEDRSVACYVLEPIPGAEQLRPSEAEKGEKMAYGRGIEATAAPMEFVRMWFESMAGKPVIDETGLEGLYDIELEWADRETMFESLAGIGLRLREAEREAAFLVITPR